MTAIAGKTILLTGGAGFIGTTLCERLVENNRLRLLDTLHRDALSKTSLGAHPNVELIVGDVQDAALVTRVMQGCQWVVHLASIAGVDTVMRLPVQTMTVALRGTMNVLDAALALGTVERLIDFSTSEVFGRYAFRVTEGDATTLGAVGEARWTYAVSKLATEHLCYNYFKQYGLQTVSIRPFNIYGPNQVGEGAVHHFILRALRDEPLTIHNDGSQIRSWCYIDDIVDGILLALTRPEAVGQSFNIGNPRSTVTIYNLAREIVRLSGSRSELRFVDWQFPDVELRIPDIRKARETLGFEPTIDLEEGLLKTIDWYRSRLERTPNA
ncbi:MAG: NAD-dependent epimerase/dehydratase family protein [Myxococcales bacterium]|nr:NAD-dependent epimerase/dehydratase family protein [Myxococcales bacterium]